ncbi:MAG: hypothetical protein M3R15_13115, partial [Acidobacteriota bacterium]|nr:hypothetical protein [Acidobacteriota bacterium]
VRHALELGEMLHLETASEELTDEFLTFAIQSGLLKSWAEGFPSARSATIEDSVVGAGSAGIVVHDGGGGGQLRR